MPKPTEGRTAVLLIAHGSRHAAANDDLHRLAARFAEARLIIRSSSRASSNWPSPTSRPAAIVAWREGPTVS